MSAESFGWVEVSRGEGSVDERFGFILEEMSGLEEEMSGLEDERLVLDGVSVDVDVDRGSILVSAIVFVGIPEEVVVDLGELSGLVSSGLVSKPLEEVV